jgi:8-oxo-dGTP pyrophosphatase MutT (NUDIX family)
LLEVLAAYRPASLQEQQDLQRVRTLVASGADPWTRASPLHVTGSAIVVHPPSKRVLLRWHARQQAWLQVGGHADPGEADPFAIALREAREETGLGDLRPWPNPDAPLVVHVAIVPVAPGKGEPAHEHADIRYTLASRGPEAIVAEADSAQLAWLSVDQALDRVAQDTLRTCLERIRGLFEALPAG